MEDKSKNSLKYKWSNFINVMLDPWVVLLLISTIAGIFYSIKIEDKNIFAILTLIISIASGLLGGIIASRWAQMTELKVLVARGKSAIRSLKLILLNISNIEKRTKVYITRIDKDNKEHKSITSNFEEVIEKCNTLEEEIINSIENWTDIIPEVANIKTQIGVISGMKLKYVELQKEISNLNQEITKNKEEGSKQKNELHKILSDKEIELTKTKQKLSEAESKINTSVLSGLTGPQITVGSTGSLLYDFPAGKCKKCGEELSTMLLDEYGLCEECRLENITGFSGKSYKS